MNENKTPEQYQAEINQLYNEVYTLKKNLSSSRIHDPKNPFDNPTENHSYNEDYSTIEKNISDPNFDFTIKPEQGEIYKIKYFYSIGAVQALLLAVSKIVIISIFSVIFIAILKFINPEVSTYAISNYFNNGIAIVLTIIFFMIGNIVFGLIGLKMSKINPKSLFKTENLSFKSMAFYIVIVISLGLVANLIGQLTSNVIMQNGFTFFSNSNPTLNYSLSAQLMILFYSIIIAPITEEFFYRGMILKSFSRTSQRFGIIFSALLFGLSHQSIVQTVSGFIIGIFLAQIAIKHNSIVPSIILHIAVNLSLNIMNYAYTLLPYNIYIILYITYLIFCVVGLLLFIEFKLRTPLPATTPCQSRRGFNLAITCFPVISLLIIDIAMTIINSL